MLYFNYKLSAMVETMSGDWHKISWDWTFFIIENISLYKIIKKSDIFNKESLVLSIQYRLLCSGPFFYMKSELVKCIYDIK